MHLVPPCRVPVVDFLVLNDTYGNKGPGSKDYAPFSTTKERIVQKVRADYEYGYDLAKCIEDGKKIDLTADKPTC